MTKNAEVLRRLREVARAAGLCNECRARPVKPGRATCEPCLDAHRSRKAAYEHLGLCGCGREKQRPIALCEACNRAAIPRKKARRKANVLAGLCACGGPRAPGIKRCLRCNEAVKRNNKAQRLRHLAAGLCAKCTAPHLPDSTYCALHLERMRQYAKVKSKTAAR